jgi:hypothetical protein
MSEPTVDEMLQYLKRHTGEYGWDQIRAAIIDILEAHRELAKVDQMELTRQVELEAIRAFVERVERRLPSYSSGRGADEWLKNYHRAVKDELDAMQQEPE